MNLTVKRNLGLLTSMTIGVGTVLLPHVAIAGNHNTFAQTRIAQASSAAPASGQNRLNLTKAQQEKIQMILKNQNLQIVSILTPSQRALVKQSVQAKQAPGSVNTSLNLTADQKSKIQSIQAQSDQQIRAILTPEQLKNLDGGSNRKSK